MKDSSAYVKWVGAIIALAGLSVTAITLAFRAFASYADMAVQLHDRKPWHEEAGKAFEVFNDQVQLIETHLYEIHSNQAVQTQRIDGLKQGQQIIREAIQRE